MRDRRLGRRRTCCGESPTDHDRRRSATRAHPRVAATIDVRTQPALFMTQSTDFRAADNVDPGELAKFSALAHRWWDPESEFKPLHEINPLRLEWIDSVARGIAGRRVLDVGCGGGILA